MPEEINAVIKRRSEKQTSLKENENKKVETSKEVKRIKETNIDSQMNKINSVDNIENVEKRENIKTGEIRILKVNDKTVFAESKGEKIMNPKDKFYSVRLPRYIQIDKNIIKYKDEIEKEDTDENKNENENEDEENDFIKYENNTPFIQWQFDIKRFNKMKKSDFSEIFKDEKRNENEDSFEKGEERNTNEDIQKHQKKENETNDEVLTNEEKKKDMKYQTKIENQEKKKNICKIKTMEDLYTRYKIKDYKYDNASYSNKILKDNFGRKTIDLSKNLEFLHTNSFLVEYDTGDFVLFVDGKPFTLECDNEVSYLIEGGETKVKPVYAKVEKRFILKAVESPKEHKFKRPYSRRSERGEEEEEEDEEEDEDEEEEDEVFYSLTNEQEK